MTNLEKAQAYARCQQIQLGPSLGFGTHGNVFVAVRNLEPTKSAVKVHNDEIPYRRECRVYERLLENGIVKIDDFHVPQLLMTDDALLVIEMTIVEPPFLLDFGGAYLDGAPEFGEEVWAEWQERKQEEFGSNWPKVEDVLCTLKGYGIHLLDVHPRNITFG